MARGYLPPPSLRPNTPAHALGHRPRLSAPAQPPVQPPVGRPSAARRLPLPEECCGLRAIGVREGGESRGNKTARRLGVWQLGAGGWGDHQPMLMDRPTAIYSHAHARRRRRSPHRAATHSSRQSTTATVSISTINEVAAVAEVALLRWSRETTRPLSRAMAARFGVESAFAQHQQSRLSPAVRDAYWSLDLRTDLWTLTTSNNVETRSHRDLRRLDSGARPAVHAAPRRTHGCNPWRHGHTTRAAGITDLARTLIVDVE